jgi:DNA-binding NarL/FixJ family response regulator
LCSERGIELSGLYLRAYRARLELHEGNWAEAADAAAWVLRTPRTSTTPRILALAVIGLLRARRGDPAPREPLDEAWTLAAPTGELERLGVVAAALAEVAWLEGDVESVDAATSSALELALERRAGWMVGELGAWRQRAGLPVDVGASAAGPYALLLDGHAVEAAAQWKELGCPYEAALALADADEDDTLRRALEEMQRLNAPMPAALIARRLRERGVRGVPRGPRAATQRNPGGLTPREHEVLMLVAEGLRNAEIATRLVVSERTVDHHVAAVFRKLDVCTRADAAATAVRLGVVAQDR